MLKAKYLHNLRMIFEFRLSIHVIAQRPYPVGRVHLYILDRKREETFFRLLLCLYNMRRVARVQDHVQWFPHTEEKETIYTHCSFHTPILFSRGLPVCDLVRARPVSCCTKTTTTEKKLSGIKGLKIHGWGGSIS